MRLRRAEKNPNYPPTMPRRPISNPAERRARLWLSQTGWRAAFVAGVLFFTATPAFPAGFFERLFHHEVQVITSTDFTPAGALLRPPSPSEPIYYAALVKGYHAFGATLGGERFPAPQDAVREIVRVLAEGGYLPANAQHRATQAIIFTWGTMYPDVAPNLGNPDMPGGQVNYRSMLGFLGGDKLGLTAAYASEAPGSLLPGLTSFDPDATAISSVARESLYVVALAGFEFPVAQPKHPKLLWRTKVSCPATGLLLADTLPTMLTIAAPNIGRATARPVWVNAADKFKPEVRIGNSKFEGYLGSSQSPAADEKAAPAKTGSDGK
jgi:hypothetical protein